MKNLMLIAVVSLISASAFAQSDIKTGVYCDDQKSAEERAQQFFISENGDGRIYITATNPYVPKMPKNLGETVRLRNDFQHLSQEQVAQLSTEEQAQYLALEQRMKIYDTFVNYMASLKCFEHFGIRYSVANNLTWQSEVLMSSNLYANGWKSDVYAADVDMKSKIERKYIFVGPCRVTPENTRCIDQQK